MAPDRATELFFELFSGLPRQGPGTTSSTRRALSLVPGVEPGTRVLDVGCGTGAPTLVLAHGSPARIVAVDNHPPFIDALNREARRLGITDRLEATRRRRTGGASAAACLADGDQLGSSLDVPVDCLAGVLQGIPELPGGARIEHVAPAIEHGDDVAAAEIEIEEIVTSTVPRRRDGEVRPPRLAGDHQPATLTATRELPEGPFGDAPPVGDTPAAFYGSHREVVRHGREVVGDEHANGRRLSACGCGEDQEQDEDGSRDSHRFSLLILVETTARAPLKASPPPTPHSAGEWGGCNRRLSSLERLSNMHDCSPVGRPTRRRDAMRARRRLSALSRGPFKMRRFADGLPGRKGALHDRVQAAATPEAARRPRGAPPC